MKIKEIKCKTGIGKCGFPGGGLAINPYIGCGHNCLYCYARFMKRFTGHTEDWGTFVDVKKNIKSVLEKQMASPRYKGKRIFIGTVTDPYQPIEKDYRVTREIIQVLVKHNNPLSILTKSDLVLRDLNLLKKIKKVDLNFTVNTLNGNWQKIVEPNSSSTKERLKAMKKLTEEGISVFAMMGPYWPLFTDAESLFKEFKKVGVKHLFTESFNTVGGNWTNLQKVAQKSYPGEIAEIKRILFNKDNFYQFYNKAQNEVKHLSKKYKIPATIYFGLGHAGKFR